jgi:hypothetical protein
LSKDVVLYVATYKDARYGGLCGISLVKEIPVLIHLKLTLEEVRVRGVSDRYEEGVCWKGRALLGLRVLKDECVP